MALLFSPLVPACSSSDSAAPAADASVDGTADASDASVPDTYSPPVEAGGCNDEQGADPLPCPPTSDASSITCFTYAHQQCVAYRTGMKKRPASSAVSCLLALSESESCGPEAAGCGLQALKNACEDPTADDPCHQIVAACGADDGGVSDAGDAGIRRSGTTFAECKQYLNGLANTGRDKMLGCMISSCGFGDCPDGGASCGGGMPACFAQLGGALPQ